jgi:hypothetical protein
MRNLKVLTVKNPYAFLILAGIKKYEIRSWTTKYRGSLYIHSAKIPIDKYDNNTINGISRLDSNHLSIEYLKINGSILGKVELVDVLKIPEQISKSTAALDGCCDIEDNDKYAWVLENPEIANLTISINGKLGIWSIESDGDIND